jgi:acyl-CoA thioesterase-1
MAIVRADSLMAKDTESQGSKFRILALGDSLTAGYKLPKEKAFSKLLEQRLVARGYSVEIFNAGVSGDTSRQAMGRIDWTLKKAGPFEAALVGIGANDGLRRIPVVQMRDNIEKIILKLKSQRLQVFLLGMKLPLNWEQEYRDSFEKTYVELARKHSVPLYPFILDGLAMNDKLNLDDRIHPNPEGHELIAERLEAWLLKQSEFTRHLRKVLP